MNDRFARQADLVPAERLAEVKATVIGVGAIGRQVALQLAALGVPHLQLIDFDTVELTNLTTQGYSHSDLGRPKVDATRQAAQSIAPDICCEVIPDRFRPDQPLGNAVFCCVDSISARAAIWRRADVLAPFWCDGRMLGESIRILTVAEEHGRTHYPTTLFAPSEAEPGRCTARSTIYGATIAAGLMLHQFARWQRRTPVDPDLSLNLLASELMVAA